VLPGTDKRAHSAGRRGERRAGFRAAASAAKAMPLSDLAAADTFSSPAAKPANSFAAPVVTTALAMPLENGEPASPPPATEVSLRRT